MGKIDSGCAGCYYVTKPGASQCARCVNHDEYVYRMHDFGVEKEMKMLNVPRIEPIKLYFDNKPLLEAVPGDICGVADVHREYIEAMERKRKKERAKELINEYKNRLVIEKVIFNDPATIVYWRDGSKTVVKADGESFDPEKGLAMAISKKVLGNEGNYYEEFKKWVPKDYVVKPAVTPVVNLTVNGPNQKEIDNAIQQIIKILGLEEKESYVCNINGDDVDSGYETLPYVGNKSYCDGKCTKCCPVDTNNKRKAGKVCKESCCNYRKHFEEACK